MVAPTLNLITWKSYTTHLRWSEKLRKIRDWPTQSNTYKVSMRSVITLRLKRVSRVGALYWSNCHDKTITLKEAKLFWTLSSNWTYFTRWSPSTSIEFKSVELADLWMHRSVFVNIKWINIIFYQNYQKKVKFNFVRWFNKE